MGVDPSSNSAAQNGAVQSDIVQLAAWLVAATVFIGGLYVGKGVLIPLAVAFLIGFALNPLVTWLSRRGVPRVMAVITVMLVLLVLVAGIGFLVASQVRGLADELPVYRATIRQKVHDFSAGLKGPGVLDEALETVEAVQTEVSGAAGEDVPSSMEVAPPQRVEIVDPAYTPLKTALEWLAPALEPIATAGIVLVFVFLVLLDRSDLRDRLIRLLGGNLQRSTDAMQEAGKRISKYLLMQVVVNISYGIPMGLGLWLIGVPGWLLWGALAALMRFVPYLGPMLSAIFPLALAFAVDPGWNMVLLTLGLILALELISNNIVEPMLYGTSTGLSAISLIAAATFWTALWGPVGLILSTPLTVCLLVVGRSHPQLQFLDTLLGSAPVLDIPTRIYQRLLAGDPEEALEIVDKAVVEDGIVDFYNDHGIEVLRRVSDDYLSNSRAEHRLRVANGMDVLLDDLREEYPPTLDPAAPPRVACIGGKWEIDSVACEMLVHALAISEISATERREGVLTARYLDKLDLHGIDIVCISYFSREPETAARTFCRRLRKRWPGKKIVLALWNAPAVKFEDEWFEQLGADVAANSIQETVRRIQSMIAPEVLRATQTVEAPENDEERVKALHDTKVLDGHAREELDGLAKRAADIFDVGLAVISVIDDVNEFIVGQNKDLPGERTHNGTDMITMPRNEAICDQVVSTGEVLIVGDTKRDPRYADHPAMKLWAARFYAGAPVTTVDGLVLGALCLLGTEPRNLEDKDLELLEAMAANVASTITGNQVTQATPERDNNSASTTTGQKVPE